ncbi:mechanosensitive ion channel domain-containing protein [Salmonirosea aquatica]|uniref:Mechanosensitive ion channel n=1 Tax=Salmonirosea aquatica TaxID=2654236 RepID=A0A7C9BG60_9BACT|nr:mechanosensitive ion channel [Cytophagaceae bacterium SJW1-29]
MDKTKKIIADSETLIIFGIIVLVTVIIASLIGKYLQRILKRKSEDQNIDSTSFVFLKHIIIATIYFFGLGWALLTLPISENFAHSLFAGAGASTLILGFASQQILSNIMSGAFLIIKKPFKINDIIEIQGNRGRVIELDLHDITIEDEKKDKILIPNSMISNGIIRNVNKNLKEKINTQ